MDRLKPSSLATAREFFAGELKTVMEKQRLAPKPDSFEYLVDLLTRFLESDQFFAKGPDGKFAQPFLVQLYSEFLQGNAETKKVTLRRLGDVCLFITGFFSDSLNRKLVDVDYYSGMGGTAYLQLSHLQEGTRSLFGDLGFRFKAYSEVLGEMSERSGIQSNADLLRLYEKWLLTGSDRLRDLLATHGIQSIKLDGKVKH